MTRTTVNKKYNRECKPAGKNLRLLPGAGYSVGAGPGQPVSYVPTFIYICAMVADARRGTWRNVPHPSGQNFFSKIMHCTILDETDLVHVFDVPRHEILAGYAPGFRARRSLDKPTSHLDVIHDVITMTKLATL